MVRSDVKPAVLLRLSAKVAVVATLMGVAGCSGDDTSLTGSTPDPTAYCDQVALLDGERQEAYVGSAEHRSDVRSLIDVAPDAVIEALRTFFDFLASDAISPDNPESNVVANWPPEVQQAIGEIDAYNEASC